MTLLERALKSEIYTSGEDFGATRLSMMLKIKHEQAKGVIKHMLAKGELQRISPGVYAKPPERHWIHRARMNDAKALRAARA